MADVPESTKSRAAFALAASKIDRDARLSDLTDAEIDTLIASTRAAPPAMDREAVLEALELADATLRGANMDRAFVERKVTAAITGLKSTSTVPADTMVILHALLTEYAGQPNHAGEAYKLVDATLSADAIRQGEGVRPSDDALLPFLPDTIEAGRRLGVERSGWLTGWFTSWSPRNDNSNAEGSWSEWVELAHAIIGYDRQAIAALAATPASHASDGGKA